MYFQKLLDDIKTILLILYFIIHFKTMEFFFRIFQPAHEWPFPPVIKQIVQKGIRSKKNGYYRHFAERIEIADGPMPIRLNLA